MKRVLLRLAGFSAGYALVSLLERVVIRLEVQSRAELEAAAAAAAAADELEAARRRRRCNCSRCAA